MSIDLDRLEEICTWVRPPPWEQFSCKYPSVDTGESPQVFRHPETEETYRQCNCEASFEVWLCEMRNALPELIRLARIGQQAEAQQ